MTSEFTSSVMALLILISAIFEVGCAFFVGGMMVTVVELVFRPINLLIFENTGDYSWHYNGRILSSSHYFHKRPAQWIDSLQQSLK
jgi:hypothetical protein